MSITAKSYCDATASSLSFSRKCASSSPTSCDSSFASAIREGAMSSLGTGDFWMISPSVVPFDSTSYIDLSKARVSR